MKTDLAVGILLLLEVPAWGHGVLQDPAQRRVLPVLICSLNRNMLGRENGSPSLFGLEPVSLYMAWWEIQWLRKDCVAVSRMLWFMGVRNKALSFSVALCRSLHFYKKYKTNCCSILFYKPWGLTECPWYPPPFIHQLVWGQGFPDSVLVPSESLWCQEPEELQAVVCCGHMAFAFGHRLTLTLKIMSGKITCFLVWIDSWASLPDPSWRGVSRGNWFPIWLSKDGR